MYALEWKGIFFLFILKLRFIFILSVATDQISDTELNQIKQDIAEVYGIPSDSDDVALHADYMTTGTLDVILPNDVSTAEALDELQEAIALSLHVHPRHVSVDIVDDEIVYTITNDDYATIAYIQDRLNADKFERDMNRHLDESDSDIIVNDINANPDIEINISGIELSLLCNYKRCFEQTLIWKMLNL